MARRSRGCGSRPPHWTPRLPAACSCASKRQAGRACSTACWVTPDGEVRHYDKRHLFRYAREHERYAAGSERLVVEWKGWHINPLVCYDLRFPVFARRSEEPPSE